MAPSSSRISRAFFSGGRLGLREPMLFCNRIGPDLLGGVNLLLGLVDLDDICFFRALGYHLVINYYYLAFWIDNKDAHCAI